MSGLRIQTATATKFRAVDPADSRWFIKGDLHSDGSLSFLVQCQRGHESALLQGHEFFDAMMNHFGDRVAIIVSHWTDSPGFDTNLEIFNAKIRSGMSEMDAVFHTKTGAWAKSWGFSMVQYLDMTPVDTPGGYEQVVVEFAK